MKTHRWTAVLLLFWILGSWKGYLALYEGNAREPRQIYPLQVALLPEEDQKNLEAGILIRNERKLRELLEAYLS